MQGILEFTNANPWLVSGLVASGLAVLFYELKLKAQGIGSVSTQLAVQLINRGSAVIDVRAADAYAAGHINDARHVPQDELLKSPETLDKNKKGTLLVCDNGVVSGQCAAKLRKEGNDNVYSIKGGLQAWQQENLPVVSNGQ